MNEEIISTHPVEHLFARVEQVAPYPAGVLPFPGRIDGTAFFPGGAGLWQTGPDLPAMPTGEVMVLGHNFDTLKGFRRSLSHHGENLRGPTWRNLLTLLRDAGVSPESCFFTNVYMGLIDGPSAVGNFPGATDAAFVSRCQLFLAEQIAIMQPRVILTLGKEVVSVLAALSSDLMLWRNVRGLPALDQSGTALICPVKFMGVSHTTAVVALTHPALRHLNINRRRYGDKSGQEAELALIADAIKLVGTSKGDGA
jgi:uracil-DNA glycosylase